MNYGCQRSYCTVLLEELTASAHIPYTEAVQLYSMVMVHSPSEAMGVDFRGSVEDLALCPCSGPCVLFLLTISFICPIVSMQTSI